MLLLPAQSSPLATESGLGRSQTDSLILPNIVKLAVPRGTNLFACVFIEMTIGARPMIRRRHQSSTVLPLLQEIPSCTPLGKRFVNASMPRSTECRHPLLSIEFSSFGITHWRYSYRTERRLKSQPVWILDSRLPRCCGAMRLQK